MPGILELNSPTETTMELVSPTDTLRISSLPNDDNAPKERVKMKKELGLLEGCAIILGIIFGSGIFISPKVINIFDVINFFHLQQRMCRSEYFKSRKNDFTIFCALILDKLVL